MQRVGVIFGHLDQGQDKSASSTGLSGLQLNDVSASATARFKNCDDDVVIVSALRTPIGKARTGSFKETHIGDLLSAVFKGVLKESGIRPDLIGDICVGNVQQKGSSALNARVAQIMSGIPETVPLTTVNRQCSSGLQAVANIASSIKAGNIDIGIGAGVESLTTNSMGEMGDEIHPDIMDDESAKHCLTPMGITSENVAEKFGISRLKQDTMAVDSHLKAHRATEQGYFKNEIVPVTTTFTDKEGNTKTITVTKDDGIRPKSNIQTLSKLRPAFKEGGSTTAGNSSQVSDGAAAVLLARRSVAKQLGLKVLGVWRSFAVVGVPPAIMGVGPAYAIPPALQKAGLSTGDVDVYEINEAFASQATYCVEKLGIPMEKVNPNGGAIALGHPLGCTGARQTATLLHELKRRGNRGVGVVSMCIGTGMGAAAVIEYPGQ